MSDIATIRRQLKIQSGATKRLFKEHNLYRKEAEDQKRKLDKFKADGAEEWDIKNAGRVLDEATRMITDSANRLGKAAASLRDLIVVAKGETDLRRSEELLKAEETMEEVSV